MSLPSYQPRTGALREQLNDWLRHDVIEPADSLWSSNLVTVKKKGGKIRWCVDWRRLNKVTKKDSWPMPTMQDTIARLAGSDIFSGVDMAILRVPGEDCLRHALQDIPAEETRIWSHQRPGYLL